MRLDGPAPAVPGAPASPSLLVAFWASWCPPCREETPELVALASDPPDGLQVVVVSEDETLAAVEAHFGGPPPPTLNLRLDTAEALKGAFGVSTLPTAVLVVRGQAVARFEGPGKWDSRPTRALLQRLLAERAAAPAGR